MKALLLSLLLPAAAAWAGDSLQPVVDRGALLRELRACRDAIPKKIEIHYESPCIHKDVSSLSGISRAELVAALGPPNACSSKTHSILAITQACSSSDESPGWSFDVGPSGQVSVVLNCTSDESQTCKTVRWLDFTVGWRSD